ncbi:MAG: hypothetical protein JNJ59_17840 [Deltaproteobacteria bacterium]|nr:hypothetical protein [Deltaproteobacteria bacterium]
MRAPLATALLALLIGCDDASSATDTSADTADTSVDTADTSAPPDTADTADTSAPPDTADTADTSTPLDTADTSEDDTASALCGCDSPASCLFAKTSASCASVAQTCTGQDMTPVAACGTDDAMATCTRGTSSITYHWSALRGFLADAKAQCDAGGAAAGTFAVASIPAGDGTPCSCQRSASACVQTFGAACSTFTCDAGVESGTCSTSERLRARCVTRDGQREVVFYANGLTLELAETTCLGASAFQYYWFPDPN